MLLLSTLPTDTRGKHVSEDGKEGAARNELSEKAYLGKCNSTKATLASTTLPQQVSRPSHYDNRCA
jgi:hypothetical protein